jgi:hypothetical protein
MFKGNLRNNTQLNYPHDVFICYRHEGGVDLASRVKEFLDKKGYSVFMDIENLKSGPFNKELLTKIENAKDVIIILTKGSLDRCINENDWVRIEIAHAIKNKRNLVPIIASGFHMPDSSKLPDEINELPNYHALNSYNDLFEQSMERMAVKFLTSKPKRNIPINVRIISKSLKYTLYLTVIILFSIFLINKYDVDFQRAYHKVTEFFNITSNNETSTIGVKQLSVKWFMETTEGPFPRSAFSMAYDPVNNYIVLHGGFGQPPSYTKLGLNATTLSDTWIWQDAAWKKLSDGVALNHSSMLFDNNLGKIIMFGGSASRGTFMIYNTIWTWSGEDWITLDVKGPEKRYDHDMAYDMKRNSLVLFGGFTRSANHSGTLLFRHLGDTW